MSFGIDAKGLFFFNNIKYLKLAGFDLNFGESIDVLDDLDPSSLNKRRIIRKMTSFKS